ncbi:uncharacterized protein LOC120705103 isoform X1 [Panicum virgatum]|uniref:Uncharacterized protein n=1 Tax=Panicum virgatum TaxID=38727 RepID=A0A8T0TQE0_PANVG|nr:uncharacterized protein LOC120705103 isoform X1 [Panicum virgatum]KAG2611265.1 hypothetical protein PVAP13_4KG132500 [Panicum virgatum]
MRTGLNSVHPLAHSVEQAVGDAVQTEVASLLFAVLAHAVVETDAADSCNAAKRKMRTGEAKTMLTSMKSKCSSPIAVYLRGRASHGSGVAAEPPRRHTSCSTAVSRANQEVKKELAAFIDVAPFCRFLLAPHGWPCPRPDAQDQRQGRRCRPAGWRTRGVLRARPAHDLLDEMRQ